MKPVRMLIVDDEALAREFMRDNFPWNEWEVEVVGEAENGREALEQCAKLQPDIALIDITMPIMDGLTLLDCVLRDFPDIRCIVVTAHRDFDYIQQAMRKGAVGYIVKSPVDTHETKAVLDRARRDLEKSSLYKQSLQKQASIIQTNNYPLRKKFFDDILTGVLSEEQEIVRRGEAIGIDLQAASYALICCQVDHLQEFTQRFPEQDRILIEFSLLEIVREALAAKLPGAFELFPVSFGQFVIVAMDKGSLDGELVDDVGPCVRTVDSQLKTPLEQYMNIRIVLSVGRRFSRLVRLDKQYKQALQQFPQRFYHREPQPIFPQQTFEFPAIPADKLTRLADQFRNIVQACSNEDVSMWLANCERQFMEYRSEPQQVLAWFASLQPETVTEASAWPDFQTCPSLSEALSKVERWVRDWFRLRSTLIAVRPEIASTIQFIKYHLSEELTLEHIAEQVRLSPSHLGHIFKKEVGVPIFDYIIEQRISLAKKYLASGQYKNYELADMVGFRSYSYFCTLFKNFTGMTPNDYKRSAKQRITTGEEDS